MHLMHAMWCVKYPEVFKSHQNTDIFLKKLRDQRNRKGKYINNYNLRSKLINALKSKGKLTSNF